MFTILIIICFVSVVGIIIKIVSRRPCPTDEELRRAVLFPHDRNDSNKDRIITHLGICQECRDKIDEINKR